MFKIPSVVPQNLAFGYYTLENCLVYTVCNCCLYLVRIVFVCMFIILCCLMKPNFSKDIGYTVRVYFL